MLTVASLLLSYLSVMRSRYDREWQATRELEQTLDLAAVRDAASQGLMRRLFSMASGRDYRPVVEIGPGGTMWQPPGRYRQWTDKDNLKSIRYLRNLRTVSVGGGHVTDESLEHLGELANLEYVLVFGEHIRGDGFRRWSTLRRLRTVYLADSSVDDGTLGYLKEVRSLEELILEGRETPVSDDGLREFGKFPKLRALALCGLRITDRGLLCLKEVRTLKELSLSDNPNVSQQGIDALRAAVPHLKIWVQQDTGSWTSD